MTSLAVVTPSYAPDAALFEQLHDSVLRWTPPGTVHHVLVPDRDLALFSAWAGPRLEVHTASELLPTAFRAVPRVNAWVNMRRPWPPVRGWVAQQILKLAAASTLDSDLVLLADSDVCLIRPVDHDTFLRPAGRAHFYALPDGVDERLPRHVLWHEVARRLLGLPQAPPPLHDYVSALTVWQPAVVRELLLRVETTGGRRWVDQVGACLHFSEFVLYGVFVDEILRRRGVAASPDMLCHSWWYEDRPLDPVAAREFVAAAAPTDVAVMISARSGTSLEARRSALGQASGA